MAKVCKDGQNIKRRLPFELTDQLKSDIEKCTIYIENFPQKYTGSDVAHIFKNYKVRDVRVSHGDKTPNGSFAFVELDSPEAVEKAILELENTTVDADSKLKIMRKSDWLL